MSKLKLKLPKDLADDLTLVCKLGTEKLSQISQSLNADDVCIIKPSELRALISRNVAKDEALAVQRVLLGFSTICRRKHVSVNTVVESVTEAVAAQSTDQALLELWESTKFKISELLEKRSVRTTSKTLELIYDYERTFHAAKILTDVRPVFNEVRDSIVGITINQSFKLEYSDSNGDRNTLTLCMDEEDIKRLKISCDQALQKTLTIKRTMEEKLDVSTLTISDIDNEA